MPIHVSWKSSYDEVLSDLYLNFEIPAEDLVSIFGVSHRTIGRQLKRLNILRSRSEATRLSWKHGTKKYNYDAIRKGEESTSWKGGKCKDSKGYVLIYAPENPLSEKRGYVLEHRLVWFSNHPETPRDWIIHHLNGIRNDNRIENLFACSRKKHISEFPNTYIRALQKRIKELEKSQ